MAAHMAGRLSVCNCRAQHAVAMTWGSCVLLWNCMAEECGQCPWGGSLWCRDKLGTGGSGCWRSVDHMQYELVSRQPGFAIYVLLGSVLCCCRWW